MPQIADIVAWLHVQTYAAGHRSTYAFQDVLTGDAKKGEAYFNQAPARAVPLAHGRSEGHRRAATTRSPCRRAGCSRAAAAAGRGGRGGGRVGARAPSPSR